MTTPSKDEIFLSRIRSALETVEQWDADPALLATCRSMIPFQDLLANKYQQDDDYLYGTGNALLLKRLTKYFQGIMTWVNRPPCHKCGTKDTDNMVSLGIREAQTQQEIQGGARRVELYNCTICQVTTTFPRYNSIKTLLQTRQGRCGEYANLFGFFCRATGFETRYVLDVTDHVWVECYVNDTWIMADACEGLINKAAMYEDGWGKKLSYQLGVTVDSIMDVSPRYTRQWNQSDYQARRREICSSEMAGQQIIASCNQTLRKKLGLVNTKCEELDRRMEWEQAQLNTSTKLNAWTKEETHGSGRISGSLQWKVARQEDGLKHPKSNEGDDGMSLACGLLVEQFYPQQSTVTITVTPHAITVSGSTCDVGKSKGISVVVVDESYLGCILQSRSFDSWDGFANFVVTLPSNRIVAVNGLLATEHGLTPTTQAKLKCLGAFLVPPVNEGILYIGQVEATPKWTISTTYAQSSTIRVSIARTTETKPLKLRTERRVLPARVAGRLDESTMPLQTQLLASENQKRMAFLSFAKQNPTVIGYTTKKGSPVYLLDASSFPFQPCHELATDVWNTFHFLPQQLVPEDDVGVVNEFTKKVVPRVDIPVDNEFFVRLFGPSILVKANGTPTLLDTPNALQNARLVALYFSAHWCGPCRSFTPMLAECFSQLKELFPSHGLEIVFVTSDKDISSFTNYFASMPWHAIPFQAGVQQQIKMTFGVQGIPSLVVLDAMSGQIVVNKADTRGEVMQAYRGGDHAIAQMLQSWLGRIPSDSLEVLQMLELSMDEADEGENLSNERKEHSYCVKREEVNPAERIKALFTNFVEKQGIDPNTAVVKALEIVKKERSVVDFTDAPWNKGEWTSSTYAASGNIEDCQHRSKTNGNISLDHRKSPEDDLGLNKCVARIDPDSIKSIAGILSKYLNNAIREPSNPKFRSMKLSNKVVDRISQVDGGLDLMHSLGFDMYPSPQDYYVSIPLHTNLEQLKSKVDALSL